MTDQEGYTQKEMASFREQIAEAERTFEGRYTPEQLSAFGGQCLDAIKRYRTNQLTAEQYLLSCKTNVPEEIRNFFGLDADGLLEPIREYWERKKTMLAVPVRRSRFKELISRFNNTIDGWLGI